MTLSKEPVTGMETTVIGLFLAAAGCRMADRLSNEDVIEDVAVMDVGTTLKNIMRKCYSVSKECLKTGSLSHSVIVIRLCVSSAHTLEQ